MIQPLNTLKTYLIIVALMFLLVHRNYAQNIEELIPRVSYWEFGFSGGISKFIRSTNPNSNATLKKFAYWDSRSNIGVSLSAIKHISPVFSLEFDYLKTALSGSWDPNSGYAVPAEVLARGLSVPPSFKTGINQISISLNTNLNKLFFPKLAGDFWYIYINGGVGYTMLKYKKGFETLSGSKSKGMVLYGPGVSVKINENINGLVGFTRYIVYSDRLDALHTVTSDLNGSTEAVMNVNERYNFSYIGITYRFDQNNRKQGRVATPYYKSTGKRTTVLNRFFRHIF
jgi:hypothetical protein